MKIKNEHKRLDKLFVKEWDEREATHKYLTGGQYIRMILWSIFCPNTIKYFMYVVCRGMATPIAYSRAKSNNIKEIKEWLEWFREQDELVRLEKHFESKVKK